jgi:hypothetical protein
MIARLSVLVLAGSLCASGAQAVEQVTVGNTKVVVRTVTGQFGEELRVLQLQDDVYHDELIETDPESATKLVFLDDTTLTLGPDARVVLDRFVYDPDPSKAEFVMTATQGLFRFATGKLPKSAYRLNTPAATIGIRGTVLTVAVLPAADGPGVTVEVAVEHGEAMVRTCEGGLERVIPAGQTIVVGTDQTAVCPQL